MLHYIEVTVSVGVWSGGRTVRNKSLIQKARFTLIYFQPAAVQFTDKARLGFTV